MWKERKKITEHCYGERGTAHSGTRVPYYREIKGILNSFYLLPELYGSNTQSNHCPTIVFIHMHIDDKFNEICFFLGVCVSVCLY